MLLVLCVTLGLLAAGLLLFFNPVGYPTVVFVYLIQHCDHLVGERESAGCFAFTCFVACVLSDLVCLLSFLMSVVVYILRLLLHILYTVFTLCIGAA